MQQIEFTKEELAELVEREWEPIQTIGVLDALIKNLYGLVADKEYRISYQIALVDAIQLLVSLMNEDSKSEHEEYMNVLITSRERLLKMYQNHLE